MSQFVRAGVLQPEHKQKIESVLRKNFRYIQILKPMEVAFAQNPDLKRKQMQQVRRITPDIYQTQPIHSIFACESQQPCTLSRFKFHRIGANEIRPKIVICICAYNEDKGMLKNSLNGIYDSLQVFREKAGILPEQIVVVVIFDGIENLRRGDHDEDIITFFDQIDYMNGSILREGEESFEANLERGEDINWDRASYYTKEEIKKNHQGRFRTIYNDYMKCKKLKKACEAKDRPFDLDKVPDEVREKYKELKKKEIDSRTEIEVNQTNRKRRRGKMPELTQPEINKIRKEHEQRFQSFDNHKNFVQKSYIQIKELTNKYLNSREDTSLIYPMDFTPNPGPIGSRPSADQVMLNVLLCVKHKNAGKLSSHALFFLGFCQLMDPELCMLMDVGLKPLDDAIFKMFEYMDLHPNTGGTCGYMGLRCERSGDEFGESNLEHLDFLSNKLHNSLFSIQKAQLFQYHFGHLIDKPFEAWFNFIHVLPGAFSCYRYECLRGESLMGYLSPVLEVKDRTLEEENRYLAEDRTLSLILKAKKFDFAYLPKAKAVVDPASDLVTMFGQRRRWINGSWFAFFHVFQQRHQISSCLTHLQFYYYYFIHGLTFVSLGLYFISLFLTIESVLVENMGTSYDSPFGVTPTSVAAIVNFVYIIMLGSMFFLSLQVKNNDKRFQTIYYFISSLLGLYGILVLVLMVYNVANIGTEGFTCKGTGQKTMLGIKLEQSCIPAIIRSLMIGTIVIYGLQVVFCFSWRIIWEILISVPSYLFYAPTYMNLLMIYAFCKIDDFSWGTKGLQKSSTAKLKIQQENRVKKYKHVGKYLFWNSLVAIIIIVVLQFNEQNAINGRVVFVLGFAGFLFFITVFKFIISLSYLISYYIRDSCFKYSEEAKKKNEDEGNAIIKAVDVEIEKIKQKKCKEVLRNLNATYMQSCIRISNLIPKKLK